MPLQISYPVSMWEFMTRERAERELIRLPGSKDAWRTLPTVIYERVRVEDVDGGVLIRAIEDEEREKEGGRE